MIKAIVPEHLNDITLGQMQLYEKRSKDITDVDELRSIMLDVFCKVDSSLYNKINAQQLLSISNRIESVLNTQPKHELFFSLEGVKMGFIPNLDEITMGEFIDLENLGSDTEGWHKIMAVLYRPVTKTFGNRYLIEAYQGSKDAAKYKEMPLGVALGAMLFFWNLGRDLLNDTLKYLTEVAGDPQQSIHLQKSGIGLEQFTDSLKETLDELTRSQPYLSTHVSIGSATKVTSEN